MTQTKYTIPADYVHTYAVGSLDQFRHKLRMANDSTYRQEQRAASHQPTTFQAVFGLKPKPSMREALGL